MAAGKNAKLIISLVRKAKKKTFNAVREINNVVRKAKSNILKTAKKTRSGFSAAAKEKKADEKLVLE